MSADMKTLREALSILEDLTDEVPLEAKQEHPLWPSECVASLASALDELEALRALAEKVNGIRNSIIGSQTLNWSEHIYPLVAALDAAGVDGLPYDEARANFGTLIERATKAETQRDELARVLQRAKEWMGYNPPTTGWGLLDHGEDKTKRDIMARGNAAIANARGGK